jgi:transcriptional regulator GlxA family with amidase domain
MPHRVVALVVREVVAFDLSIPAQVFGHEDERHRYALTICAEHPGPVTTSTGFAIVADQGLDALAVADTVVVPGIEDTAATPSRAVLAAVGDADRRGARMVSICTGAFVLAGAGVLDGRRATTHWLAATALAQRHPEIEVDPDVLYVDNGQFLTSAGAAAGLDLCLHLIRRDHGSAVAADAARLSVMPLEREGGQAQFIVQDQPPTPQGSVLEPLLRWMEDNTAKDLTLDDIATHAG